MTLARRAATGRQMVGKASNHTNVGSPQACELDQ